MEPHWLVRPSTIRRLWVAMLVILAATVVVELLTEHHPVFGVDGSFGFNAWFGFGSCIFLIVLAKVVGVFLKRRDSYYEDQS